MKVVHALLGLLVLAVVSLRIAAEVITSTAYHYITTTAIATLRREYCSCEAISTQRVSAPTPTTSTMGSVINGGTSIYSYGSKSVLESSSMIKSTGPFDTYTSEVHSLTVTTTAFTRSPEPATTSTITNKMSTDFWTSHSVVAATSQINGGPQQAGASSSAAPYVKASSSRTSGTSHVTSSGSVVDLPQSQTSTSQSSSLVSELTSSARSDTTFTSLASEVSPAKTSETQSTTASQYLDASVSSFVVPRTSTSTSQSSSRSSAPHISLPPGVSISATLHTSVPSSVIGRTSPISTSVGNVASIQPPTVATREPTSMLSEFSSTSTPEKGTPLPSSFTSPMSVTRSTMGSSSAAQSAVVSDVDWPRSFPFLRTTAVVAPASLTTASLSPTSIARPLPFPRPSIVGRPVNLFWEPIWYADDVNDLISMDYTTHAFTRKTNYFFQNHNVSKDDMTTTPRFVFYLSIEDKTITTDRGNLIGYDKSKIATGARLYYDDLNKTLTTNEFIITNDSLGTISVPDCSIFRDAWSDNDTLGIILSKNLENVHGFLGRPRLRFLNLPDWPAMEVPP